MASAEDCWRCPFCERLHASWSGVEQHISNDACRERKADERRRLREHLSKPAQTEDELEAAGDPFAGLDRGE